MENPFSSLDDKKLMLKYQQGDHMAFDVLYSRHKDKVYSYIAKRVHQTGEIEDLYQKVFIKFHKAKKLYDPKYEVLPWLYTITKNEFLDFIKKRKMESVEFNEQIHGVSNTDDSPESENFDLRKEKALSANEKKAIELRYLKESEFEEISKILSTSTSNARKLVSRGLKKLKAKYQRGTLS